MESMCTSIRERINSKYWLILGEGCTIFRGSNLSVVLIEPYKNRIRVHPITATTNPPARNFHPRSFPNLTSSVERTKEAMKKKIKSGKP